MKRELIRKNAKFNSKTSDTIIRVKEVKGEVVVIENVRHGSDNRYKSIPDTERMIDVASLQKAYYCGKDSTRLDRLQKNKIYCRNQQQDMVRIVNVAGGKCVTEGVYNHGGVIKPIAGSTRTISVRSLLNSYDEFN